MNYSLGIIACFFGLVGSLNSTFAESNPHLVGNLRGGLALTRLTNNVFENAYGYNMGGNVKYYFSDLLGIGTGLEYESRKLGTLGDVDNISNASSGWVDIPLTLSLRMGSTHQGLFDVGAFYAISLDSRVGKKGGSGDAIQTSSGIGPIVRAGYAYQMQNNFGVGADLTMKYLTPSSFKFYEGASSSASESDFHFVGIGMNLVVSFGSLL